MKLQRIRLRRAFLEFRERFGASAAQIDVPARIIVPLARVIVIVGAGYECRKAFLLDVGGLRRASI
jgi:hypothetical protein